MRWWIYPKKKLFNKVYTPLTQLGNDREDIFIHVLWCYFKKNKNQQEICRATNNATWKQLKYIIFKNTGMSLYNNYHKEICKVEKTMGFRSFRIINIFNIY